MHLRQGCINFHIIMEYLPFLLLLFLLPSPPLPPPLPPSLSSLSPSRLPALDHCHLCGVLHRDLKLENILLSAEKSILISDFGLGRTFEVYSIGMK